MRILGPSVNSLRDLTKPIQPAPLLSAAGMLWTSVLCIVLFFLSNPRGYDQPAIYWQHWAALISVVAFVLTFHTLRLPTIPWSALAFVGYGALTALWSPDSHVTLVFAARLVALTLLAAYVAAALEFRAQLVGVSAAGVVVAVTSAIEFARGNPEVSIWVDPDGWELTVFKGIQGNRNILSYTLVLALWALLARVPERWPARAVWTAALGVVVGGIVASESTTGLAAVVVLFILAIVLRPTDGRRLAERLGRRAWLMASLAAGLIVAGGIAAFMSQGRDPSSALQLSGRVPLWQQILQFTRGRDLWLGHGWGTVWPYNWLDSPPRTELYDQIVQPLGTDFVHGHNSLLDPLPEIGLVGVALFVAGFVWVAIKAFRLVGSAAPEHRLVGRASLLALAALAINGVTEPMSVHPVGVLVFALIAANVVAVKPKALAQTREGSE